ncbi:MAG: ankyrin repeat domain-containing protein [Acidobacteria bacterium]|nr:ankyrin repeat domain-containing protein [Acidobacteriota bacterium]
MLAQSIFNVIMAMLLVGSAGDSRIADAAQHGDTATVQLLLKEKVDVNAAQGDGNTALHWASFRDDLQMARLLIQAGASVNAKTRLGDMTPLHLAATNGSAAMIDVLLKAGSDPNVPNGNGTTPLMLAAATGKIEALKALLDRGVDPNARENTNGQTAVMFAAAQNRDAAIRLLAERGANLTVTTKASESKANASDRQARAEERTKNVAKVGGNTALHFAARDGHMEAVRALLESGADVNQVSLTDDMSPLVQAIITGHFDVAKFFLDRGANPNLATKLAGVTPLWAVIDARYAPRAWYPSPSVDQEKTSHLDLIKELLARGTDPNARLITKPWFRTFGDSNQPDPAGSTAFYRAAQANDVPAMKLLVAAGANPYIGTRKGTSPLLVAAGLQQDFQGANFVPEARMETVRFLVEELGADVNAADDRGYTVLHAAAFIGRNDVIEYLVAHGADVTRRANQISNGPSMQAAKPGQGDTVADMANGWAEKTLQFPETVNLAIQFGSQFSNTCWASVCVNPTRTDKKQ